MADLPLPKPGPFVPILWGVVGVIVTVVCGVIVGVAAYGSESAGVAATYWVAFPAGFTWAGFWGALIFHLTTPHERGLRVGAPLGCGFIGGVALLLLLFVFFVAIFPAL